jgi:hypothetical protein
MTMLGTCYLLSRTSLSPANVQRSIDTIYSSVGRERIEPGFAETEDLVSAPDAMDDVVSNMIVASIAAADTTDSQVCVVRMYKFSDLRGAAVAQR